MDSDKLTYCYKTNITFVNALSQVGQNAMQDIKERAKTEKVIHATFEKDNSCFADEWLAYMAAKGLIPTSTLIIGRIPGYEYPYAHYDKSLGIYDSGALNWVEDNNDDSEMVWYNMPDVEGFEFPINYRYINYRTENLTEHSRKCVAGGDNMTLVRTDAIHSVIMGNLPRLAVSVRFTEGAYTWAQSVNRMKEFII